MLEIRKLEKINKLCTIRNKTYIAQFRLDTSDISDAPRVLQLLGLERSNVLYVLALLEDGTYRLYSKAIRKLYTAGKTKDIKWIEINEEG